MPDFKSVLSQAGLSDPVVECALGNIACPIGGVNAPFDWYGFPPALIPIWSEASGPNYYGYWKHWFADRKPSFVKMYVGAGREVVEIARSPDQFFCYIIARSICVCDGVNSKIEKFAEMVGVENLAEIDDVTLNTGDDPKGLVKITQFRTDTPQESIQNLSDYDGDFICPEKLTASSPASSFEFSKQVFYQAESGEQFPPWFDVDKVQKVFYQSLDGDDLAIAWLSLNSSGWSVSDAKNAMKVLANKSDNKDIERLAAWWISVADEGIGSY